MTTPVIETVTDLPQLVNDVTLPFFLADLGDLHLFDDLKTVILENEQFASGKASTPPVRGNTKAQSTRLSTRIWAARRCVISSLAIFPSSCPMRLVSPAIGYSRRPAAEKPRCCMRWYWTTSSGRTLPSF